VVPILVVDGGKLDVKKVVKALPVDRNHVISAKGYAVSPKMPLFLGRVAPALPGI